jgi:hypothetical protein
VTFKKTVPDAVAKWTHIYVHLLLSRQTTEKESKKKKADKWEPPSKTRVELRFNNEVYTKIKSIADRADISVNQLIQGLARWAGDKAVVGEPHVLGDTMDGFDVVEVRNRPGCLYFGCAPHEASGGMGKAIYVLDFSERYAV